MIPKIAQIKDMQSSEIGWSNMVTDKKNDVKIDWGKSKNGLLMMRAFGNI